MPAVSSPVYRPQPSLPDTAVTPIYAVTPHALDVLHAPRATTATWQSVHWNTNIIDTEIEGT